MDAESWTERKIFDLAEIGSPTREPEHYYTRNAPDGHRLEVLVWGNGGEKGPLQVRIRCMAPVGDDGELERPRFATLEEIQDAVDLTLDGAIFQMSPFTAGRDPVEPKKGTHVDLIQMAAQKGSPAGIRASLAGGIEATNPREIEA